MSIQIGRIHHTIDDVNRHKPMEQAQWCGCAVRWQREGVASECQRAHWLELSGPACYCCSGIDPLALQPLATALVALRVQALRTATTHIHISGLLFLQ